MSEMVWAEFAGDTQTAVIVREVEIEIDLLRIKRERVMAESGEGLTEREQGWYEALFWVRSKLEDVEGGENA
jgi:hypothetical protein